jgi:hypothetical protein
MGKIYDSLTPDLQSWLAAQKMFFVASAPLAGDGLVNCSPKGTDSFRVLGPRQVAFHDLTGSGIETVAHLKENGRIVLMFCSFDDAPKIVRLHGHGRVVERDDPEFSELAAHFPAHPGSRTMIVVDVRRISDSCGFGVPLYQFVRERDTLARSCDQKGPEKLATYRSEKNHASLDGLTGLRVF